MSFGNMLGLAEEISEELNCSLVDMRFIKPLDENLIERFANKCDHIITIEENTVSGGAGSAVNEFLSTLNASDKLKIIGDSRRISYCWRSKRSERSSRIH